jgi:hypothetical protein
MSHYSTLVILEDVITRDASTVQDRIETDMAPFMENCCGTPDKIYMKFYDVENEYLEQYEKGSREMVVMPDGRLLLPWDEAFKKKPTKKDPFPKAEAPKNLERRMVPFKETFSTFEKFMEEWCGCKEKDETYMRYGY